MGAKCDGVVCMTRVTTQRVRSASETHRMAIGFVVARRLAKALYSVFAAWLSKSARRTSYDRLQARLSCVWTSHGR